MNRQLSNIELLIQQAALPEEEKQKLLKELCTLDKQWNILEFKLDRTEKVKKTTAVLLEETIEELEKKRKDAEAQNRELEIEASLERVRSVAMGMKEPADMLEICRTISHQLESLNVKEIRNVQTAIFYEDKGTYMNYEYYAKHDKTLITETAYANNEIHHAFAEQMLKGKGEFFITHIKGNEVKDWIAYQKTTNVFIDEYLDTASSLNYYWYSLGAVALGISTYEPLREEDIYLFERFLQVFELSYTRYSDIEQAIAQARESQIQLALERVRARTMAMQKSDELSEVVYVLFQQFKDLGEQPDQATIGIINENENVIEYWVTMYGTQINKVFKFSIDEPNVTNKIYRAWKENKKSLVIDLNGNALSEFMAYRAAKGGAAINPDEKRRIINVAFFSKGLLNVQSNEERSQESIKLLERFASVFEQTYTRFLDLQKAEASAREAQIEAALERVRSRTMSMQKSEELKEIIRVVYAQLVHVNILVEHAGFIMDYKERDDMNIWLADKHEVPFQVTIPYFDCAHWNSFIEAKEKGINFFTNHLSFEEKNKFYHDLFKLVAAPDEAKEYYFTCPGLAISTALLDNVGLYIENFSGVPYSDEENKTLMRFGKAFQQTYTRFLDLQKAEAQAREAQIELGLERVRARAMAMQKSDELKELIGTVFTELTKLDLVLTRCVIMIYDIKTLGITWWMANSEDPSNPTGLFVKYHQLPPHLAYIKAWQDKELKWQYVLEGKIKKEWDDFLFAETELLHLPDFVIAGMKAPERVYLNASFNSFGNLTLAGLEPLSNEHADILLRFAKVFDLTYTRFNDLKQAEAQAREAQIQLGLERVRARAMANAQFCRVEGSGTDFI